MPKPDAVTNQQAMLTQADRPLSTVNEEARTVECVFSTGDLITHWVDYNDTYQRMPTRLVLTDEACDKEQAESGVLPVLDDHSRWRTQSVLGNVAEIHIGEGEARATLRFSQADSVTDTWTKVKEGTLRQVSVGFMVLDQEIRQELDENGETFEVMYFTRWRPTEISMTAIGADRGAHTQSAGGQPNPGYTQGEPFARSHLQNTADPSASTAPAPLAADGADNAASQENIMPGTDTQTAAPNASNTQTQGQPQTQSAPVNTDEIRQNAAREERERIADIQSAGQTLNVGAEIIQSAIDGGTSVDAFRAQAIEAFAQNGQQQTSGIGGPRIQITGDANERFCQGAELGLMARAGMDGGERNEFTGMSLSELARQSLVVANQSIPFDRSQMVGAAFMQSGAHGTSDFTNILMNIMNKSSLKGWEEAEETFERWTQEGSLSDFKETKRVGLGAFDSLPQITEAGEFKYGTIGDHGETIALATYGKIIRITRQAIINDDLNMFAQLPGKMSRAAKRTVGNLVYAILTSNPKMSDGKALFHSDHKNLGASGAGMSIDTLSKGRSAMRRQVESAERKDALNISPKHLIVPSALETLATTLMKSAVDPTAGKGHAPNPVGGMAEVITEARLDYDSAASWYLAAGSGHDTVEVSYLDGNDRPYIEQSNGWTRDGVEVKVRLDAGVAPLDYRTLYKDPGE